MQIVFDHQDRAIGGDAPDQGGDAVDVFVAHARHRLVEQQHFRIERERRGDFERALAAVGDLDGDRAGPVGESDIVEQRHRPLVERRQHLLRAPEIERVAALALQRDAHVLERGQMRKHRRNLERADQPQTGDVGGPNRGDVAVVEEDAARGRPDEFGQHVEAGRLARAVGTDQGVDRAAPDPEVDVAHRREIAERLTQALGDKDVVLAHRRRPPARMTVRPRIVVPPTQDVVAVIVKPDPWAPNERPASRRAGRARVRSAAIVQAPLPIERLPDDLVEIVALRAPAQLAPHALGLGDDRRRVAGAPPDMVDREIDAGDALDDVDDFLDRRAVAVAAIARQARARRGADRRAPPDARR